MVLGTYCSTMTPTTTVVLVSPFEWIDYPSSIIHHVSGNHRCSLSCEMLLIQPWKAFCRASVLTSKASAIPRARPIHTFQFVDPTDVPPSSHDLMIPSVKHEYQGHNYSITESLSPANPSAGLNQSVLIYVSTMRWSNQADMAWLLLMGANNS